MNMAKTGIARKHRVSKKAYPGIMIEHILELQNIIQEDDLDIQITQYWDYRTPNGTTVKSTLKIQPNFKNKTSK